MSKSEFHLKFKIQHLITLLPASKNKEFYSEELAFQNFYVKRTIR